MDVVVQGLANRLLALQGEMTSMQTQRAADAQRIQQQERDIHTLAAKGAGKGGSPGGQVPTFDVRALKGMDHFDGTQRAWRDWAVVTKSYAGVMKPKLVELMTAAEQVNTHPDVRNAVLTDDGSRAASQQLYTLLLHACKGPSLNKVVNAGQGEGTVAWRALVSRYDPNALAVRAGTLQSLLSWSFSGDVLERIEAWEREVAHYEVLSGTTLQEDLRIGIVLRQMDESL